MNLWCWCPRCDRKAVYHITYDHAGDPTTNLGCQACGALRSEYGPLSQLLECVKREIDLKVRNGSWKAVVEAKAALKKAR